MPLQTTEQENLGRDNTGAPKAEMAILSFFTVKVLWRDIGNLFRMYLKWNFFLSETALDFWS